MIRNNVLCFIEVVVIVVVVYGIFKEVSSDFYCWFFQSFGMFKFSNSQILS